MRALKHIYNITVKYLPPIPYVYESDPSKKYRRMEDWSMCAHALLLWALLLGKPKITFNEIVDRYIAEDLVPEDNRHVAEQMADDAITQLIGVEILDIDRAIDEGLDQGPMTKKIIAERTTEKLLEVRRRQRDISAKEQGIKQLKAESAHLEDLQKKLESRYKSDEKKNDGKAEPETIGVILT